MTARNAGTSRGVDKFRCGGVDVVVSKGMNRHRLRSVIVAAALAITLAGGTAFAAQSSPAEQGAFLAQLASVLGSIEKVLRSLAAAVQSMVDGDAAGGGVGEATTPAPAPTPPPPFQPQIITGKAASVSPSPTPQKVSGSPFTDYLNRQQKFSLSREFNCAALSGAGQELCKMIKPGQ